MLFSDSYVPPLGSMTSKYVVKVPQMKDFLAMVHVYYWVQHSKFLDTWNVQSSTVKRGILQLVPGKLKCQKTYTLLFVIMGDIYLQVEVSTEATEIKTK